MNASSLRREIEMLLGLTGAQAANFWRIATAPSPSGPVPIPYPNIAAGAPIAVQCAGRRFDGQYLITSVQHRVGRSYMDDLAECVRAAARDDAASGRVWPLWMRVKSEIGRQPAHVRNQLGHELTHTLQQRSGRG